MPDKTHSELIRELFGQMAILGEKVERAQRDIERHDAELHRLTESLTALTIRVVGLEHQVGDLRKTAEESGRRRWSLLPPLVAAIIGGIIALLGQLLLSYLRK